MLVLTLIVSFRFLSSQASSPFDNVTASPEEENITRSSTYHQFDVNYGCLYHRGPYGNNPKFVVFTGVCGNEGDFINAVLEGRVKHGKHEAKSEKITNDVTEELPVSTPPPDALPTDLFYYNPGCMCQRMLNDKNDSSWTEKCVCGPEAEFDKGLLQNKLHGGEDNVSSNASIAQSQAPTLSAINATANLISHKGHRLSRKLAHIRSVFLNDTDLLLQFGCACDREIDPEDSKLWLQSCICGPEDDFDQAELAGLLQAKQFVANATDISSTNATNTSSIISSSKRLEFAMHCDVYKHPKEEILRVLICSDGVKSKFDSNLKSANLPGEKLVNATELVNATVAQPVEQPLTKET